MEDYELLTITNCIRDLGFEAGRQGVVDGGQARQDAGAEIINALSSLLGEHALPMADAYYDGCNSGVNSFRYIVSKSTTKENYLGFGSKFVRLQSGYCVVRCYVEHVKWQAMRLASGLELFAAGSDMTGYATVAEAARAGKEMYALLYPCQS